MPNGVRMETARELVHAQVACCVEGSALPYAPSPAIRSRAAGKVTWQAKRVVPPGSHRVGDATMPRSGPRTQPGGPNCERQLHSSRILANQIRGRRARMAAGRGNAALHEGFQQAAGVRQDNHEERGGWRAAMVMRAETSRIPGGLGIHAHQHDGGDPAPARWRPSCARRWRW